MSLIPTSTGTAPHQEWSVIQHTRTKRYDDSKNRAVQDILGLVATVDWREHWEKRYPEHDRANVPQLLGAYCYDPSNDRPPSYWNSAMNELDRMEKDKKDKWTRSNRTEEEKEEYYGDLLVFRTRRDQWYDEMEKGSKGQFLLEATDDENSPSEHTDDLSDARHDSQPRSGLNLWEQNVRERIEQGTLSKCLV